MQKPTTQVEATAQNKYKISINRSTGQLRMSYFTGIYTTFLCSLSNNHESVEVSVVKVKPVLIVGLRNTTNALRYVEPLLFKNIYFIHYWLIIPESQDRANFDKLIV